MLLLLILVILLSSVMGRIGKAVIRSGVGGGPGIPAAIAISGTAAVLREERFEHIVKIFPEAFRKVIAVIRAEPEIMLPVPAELPGIKAAAAVISAVIVITGTAAAGSVAVPGESSFEHIAKIFPEAFRKVIAVISAGAESMLPVPAGLENKAAVAAVTAVGGVILPGIPDLVHEFFLKVLRKRGTVSGGQAAMVEDLGFPILKAFGGGAG